jgi:hypothetical protein
MVPFVRNFIAYVAKIIQIPDAFGVGCARKNFCSLHNLVAKNRHGTHKALFFPILQQGHVQTHMSGVNPWIIRYRSKELRKLFPFYHRLALLAYRLSFPTATLLLWLVKDFSLISLLLPVFFFCILLY